MTATHTVDACETAQTGLIRYIDAVDQTAAQDKPSQDRAVPKGMFSEGATWLWQRVAHFGETKGPQPNWCIDRIQF